MSTNYGQPEDQQAMIALIRAAVDRGVAFIDTAESGAGATLLTPTTDAHRYRRAGYGPAYASARTDREITGTGPIDEATSELITDCRRPSLTPCHSAALGVSRRVKRPP